MNETVVPSLSITERDRRWELSRALMSRENLDALLVFGEHEDAGPAQVSYDTWLTNERPGTTVILSRDGEPTMHVPGPMFILDHLELRRRGSDSWVRPQSLRVSRTSVEIANTLVELGLTGGRIGVVGHGPHPPWHPEGLLPYLLWSRVLERLPNAEFLNVDLAFAEMTMRLSDEEAQLVRRSAEIGDAMVRAMLEAARPGVSEAQVYAAGMAEGYRHGTLPPAMHLWSGKAPVASGLPAWGYRAEEARLLADGDVIYAEVFSQFGGRHTQHQVTIAVGEVHEDLWRAGKIAQQAYGAGLASLRAGRTFGDVVEAMHKPLDAHDGQVFLVNVHSINPLLALDKARADINLLPDAEAYPDVPSHPAHLAGLVLEPGMCFALEPQYAIGGYLAHVGGTVIVTEGEPTELSPLTREVLRTGR